MTVPHSDPKPLEPWALELLQPNRQARRPRRRAEVSLVHKIAAKTEEKSNDQV